MLKKIIIGMFVVGSCIAISTACSSKTDFEKETKEATSLDTKKEIVQKEVVSETTYKVTVDLERSNGLSSLKKLFPKLSEKLNGPDANACEGEGKLILYDDYSQKLEGNIKCLGIIPIDLSGAMNSKDDLKRVKEDMSKYPYFGSIIRENNPVITDNRILEGTAYFNPPRPLIINPLVSGDKLPKKMSENSTMVFVNSKHKQIQTSGKFTILVKNPKADIPEGVDSSYIKGDIVHIDVQSSGFDGADKDRSKYLLFQSREMFISLNPLIFTKMVIHSPAKDLINVNSKIISSLVGDITIDFVMTKHEIK